MSTFLSLSKITYSQIKESKSILDYSTHLCIFLLTSYSIASLACLTDISNYVNLSSTPNLHHLLGSLSYENSVITLDSSPLLPILLVLTSKIYPEELSPEW